MPPRAIYCTVHKRRWLKWTMIILIAAVAVLTVYFGFTMRRQVGYYAEAETERVLREQINRTAQALLREQPKQNYVEIERNSEGLVQSLVANTPLVGMLATQAAVLVQSDLRLQPSFVMSMPRGALLGSAYWADKGREIDFRVELQCAVSADYVVYYQEIGINQIRHAIYLKIVASTKIVVPANAEDLEVVCYVPVSEVVYTGEVPDVYIDSADGTDYLDLLP